MMTITKSSENYTLSDSLENGWSVSGNMSVNDTEISINFQINRNNTDPSAMKPFEVGNYYWRKGDRINVSYSIVDADDEVLFLETCKALVKEAAENK